MTHKHRDHLRRSRKISLVGFVLISLAILLLVLAYGIHTKAGAWTLESDRWIFGKEYGGLGTLFTGLAFAGVIYTIILQKSGLDKAIDDFEESSRLMHYGELDTIYFELLKIAIDRPYLRDPGDTRRKENKIEYDTYAYMTWNFIEAVHDRLGDQPMKDNSSSTRHDLWETWGKAIDLEKSLHTEWWAEKRNRDKFKHKLSELYQAEVPDNSSRHSPNDLVGTEATV